MPITIAEIMEQAKRLHQQDQKESVKRLIDALAVNGVSQSETQETSRLSDLREVEVDSWQNADAQDYVDGLRDEWDQ